MTNKGCVILNADYQFLNIVDWKKAFCLITKGKAEILKYSDRLIKVASGILVKVPLIMRLIKLVRTVYRTRVPFSKKNILIRDGFKCVYCGVSGIRLTIDHVVPKVKGGKSTFENCVASCKPCNNKKGGRTCSEAKMYPRTSLEQPTINQFLQIKMKMLGVDRVIEDMFNAIA